MNRSMLAKIWAKVCGFFDSQCSLIVKFRSCLAVYVVPTRAATIIDYNRLINYNNRTINRSCVTRHHRVHFIEKALSLPKVETRNIY